MEIFKSNVESKRGKRGKGCVCVREKALSNLGLGLKSIEIEFESQDQFASITRILTLENGSLKPIKHDDWFSWNLSLKTNLHSYITKILTLKNGSLKSIKYDGLFSF